MCGIAGFIDWKSGAAAEDLAATAKAMARAISHRGPDDEGVWVDVSAGIGLGHRRLSIVDLSAEGHQPMVSHSGRFIAVFNGEIYNYVQLRQELDRLDAPPRWRGHCDTEVFLAGCEAWGVAGAIERSDGMFAIAIWDALQRQLLLARDRMGEKPLYYGWQHDVFLFGSELKALEAHRGFAAALDERAISAYLRFGYVPTPLSIYQGVRKLEPGFLLRLPARGGPGSESSGPYWQAPFPRGSAPDARDPGSIVDELHQLLRTAVKSRMHADVPLGAFLSGGIDSSTVAALMQDAAGGRVHTYSMGFEDKRHDEAVHAAAVARVLGTQHEELYVTSGDALDVIPHLPRMYDEPFADSSQIPTHLLSKLTRRHVTVALSGDAGDELFGGYVRYLQAHRLLNFHRMVPAVARGAIAAGLRRLARPLWDRLCLLGPKSLAVTLSANRLAKLADAVCLDSYREMYGRLVSQWADPLAVAPTLPVWPTIIDDGDLAAKNDPLPWMMYLDQMTYLPDDILVKVDRASMSVGLETRVPFLDHRVVEFAAAMPLTAKIRGSQGKWALRQILYRYVDRTLVERPKQGFGIPLAEWLRGPLRAWAEDLLSQSALLASGILQPDPIRRAWLDHQSGRQNQQHRLWVILMLQAWLRRSRPASADSRD